MSDPLSVAAGVVGLLTAAAQVSLILGDLISKARHAPQECKRVRAVVDDIHHVLGQLALYTAGAKQAQRSRRALIMVDQVAATLASCITTFDELKLFVEGLKSDFSMGILDRMRWVMKTSDLAQLLARLETHKSSLTLMLTILTCQKQDDAEDKVDRLCEMVEAILAQNVIIAQRMAAFDVSQMGLTRGSPLLQPALLRSATIRLSISHPTGQDPAPDTIPYERLKRNSRGFAFEELLLNSRAYRSASHNNSDAFSVVTSAGRTATWSMLSGLSLSEMSHIGILAIPVYEADLNDKAIYDFEPPQTDPLDELQPNQVSNANNTSTPFKQEPKEWWKKLKRRAPSAPPVAAEQVNRVFNVQLAESIRYANVAISLHNEQGDAFIYGYVPILVAKTGVFLKEKGTDVEDIFMRSGHAARVAQLQSDFDIPPQYGKGINWTGFTVHDAAAVLLRYLKSLPEPVIPYSLYEAFTSPIQTYQDWHEATDQLGRTPLEEESYHKTIINEYKQLITGLPPLNRQLLLYILDLLAVFGSKSDTNRMTAVRLIQTFQPSLLSDHPQCMDSVKYNLAADTGVFLIENQDNWFIGME